MTTEARVERLRRTKTIEDPSTGCWEWQGATTKGGYGTVKLPGSRSSTTAHRLFFAVLVEEIPEGAVVHHKCANSRCVNPEHLQAVSAVVNGAESYERSRLTAALEVADAALDGMADALMDAFRQDHDHDDEESYL